MGWTILVVALVLALLLWQVRRLNHKGTRGMNPDHRGIGPDEMHSRVDGDMAWGDPLRSRYRKP